ncbi:MAG: 1-acyl-sn-glycerol-3-phosphate acyltransferase [Rubrivivax sp.]|nr:1-acyl-sn-glycerol-3-phosphate acyltransferase [Rubrivivax sp.]
MLRACWRLGRAVLHGLHGVLIVLLQFPALATDGRRKRIAWWSAKLLRVLGIDLRVHGSFKPGAKLIVANHVSWIDIMVIHAVCPEARFVSKADVKQWPLVNRLVASADTLYIQRESRRDALRVVHQMAEALRHGDSVAVFPEGTTGDGETLLPFHANLLQAAIATGVPVQPVALRFSDRQRAVSEAAQFLGDTTLRQSLWMLAGADGLAATLQVLPPEASLHADRRALADHLRTVVGARLAGAPAGR